MLGMVTSSLNIFGSPVPMRIRLAALTFSSQGVLACSRTASLGAGMRTWAWASSTMKVSSLVPSPPSFLMPPTVSAGAANAAVAEGLD